MKKFLIIVMALCLMLCASAAESVASLPNAIDLYLPNDPDVGNWEYSVENENLINIKSQFFPDIHELGLIGTDGVSWFHVEGLEPGTTTLRFLYINSLTLRADLTLVYRLNVDDHLNVLIWGFEMLEPEWSPRGAIKSFLLTTGGYEAPRSYSLRKDDQGVLLREIDSEGEESISEDFLTELTKIVDRYEIVSWNGFNDSAEGVLDGEFFTLTIVWENDFSINATGDNAFPDGYDSFRHQIEQLFEKGD